MKRMEHLFIINPVAGGGKPLKLIPRIKSIFHATDRKYHIEITKRPGHATEIAREYTSKASFRVYSVGGDGTLNEVINGMAGTDSSLAVIPGGSGNDFIRTICADPLADDILERAVEGREKLIDLATVNGRYFINISSMGFDAEVALKTNKHKKFYGPYGKLAYIASVFETLVKYKNNLIEIIVDGVHTATKSLLVAIANGKYYGGGMKPAPEAQVDDGLLDVCLIGPKSRLEIVRFFPMFIKGRHSELEGVHFFKVKTFEIHCDREIPLNIDGESLMARDAVYRIIPEGIRIVIPQ